MGKFSSIWNDKALAAAIMGILFIIQTYTGFSMAWIRCGYRHMYRRLN